MSKGRTFNSDADFVIISLTTGAATCPPVVKEWPSFFNCGFGSSIITKTKYYGLYIGKMPTKEAKLLFLLYPPEELIFSAVPVLPPT